MLKYWLLLWLRHYLSVEGLLNNTFQKNTNKQETDLWTQVGFISFFMSPLPLSLHQRQVYATIFVALSFTKGFHCHPSCKTVPNLTWALKVKHTDSLETILLKQGMMSYHSDGKDQPTIDRPSSKIKLELIFENRKIIMSKNQAYPY
jgi:hypothetical protein